MDIHSPDRDESSNRPMADFEELSKIYLNYLVERTAFVQSVAQKPGAYLIYKNDQPNGEEPFNRPVVIIREASTRKWYDAQVQSFIDTIDLLVEGNPYVYSPNSVRLKKPLKAYSKVAKASLSETTAVSSTTEPVRVMRKRLERNERKAQHAFKVTYHDDQLTLIDEIRKDQKVLEKYDAEEILRIRKPSSTDSLINLWESVYDRPERSRVIYTGAAFYSKKTQDALVINGRKSLYWAEGEVEPVKISHVKALKLAADSDSRPALVVYSPGENEMVGGKDRGRKDAFDTGAVKPLPLTTISTAAVYLEKDIQAFREALSNETTGD